MRQSIGGAVTAAAELPERVAGPLLGSSRAAFVHGMRASCAICAVALLIAAVLSARIRASR